jgi:hypothetical protein
VVLEQFRITGDWPRVGFIAEACDPAPDSISPAGLELDLPIDDAPAMLRAGERPAVPRAFDDTDIPGLPPTVAYIDLRSIGPTELAKMIDEKIRT